MKWVGSNEIFLRHRRGRLLSWIKHKYNDFKLYLNDYNGLHICIKYCTCCLICIHGDLCFTGVISYTHECWDICLEIRWKYLTFLQKIFPGQNIKLFSLDAIFNYHLWRILAGKTSTKWSRTHIENQSPNFIYLKIQNLHQYEYRNIHKTSSFISWFFSQNSGRLNSLKTIRLLKFQTSSHHTSSINTATHFK
jgi:hypothetical protein